jgi:hypothetical protein
MMARLSRLVMIALICCVHRSKMKTAISVDITE